MRRSVEAMVIAARTEAPVMLLAEVGTEVNHLARFVHDNSERRGQPFLALSCPSATALPGALLQGAGTLFLDEVGELVPGLQTKLAHLLDTPSAQASKSRLISTTKHDIFEAVRKGNFRNDLFFRLNVVEIRVPPLRERRTDILPLTRELVASLSVDLGRRVPSISDEAASLLQQHSWPGNFRELKNVIERALLIWPEDVLEPEAFTEIKTADAFRRPRVGDNVTLQDLEREHILRIMTRVGDRKGAAAILGIAETTLWRRRKLYDRAGKTDHESVKPG